MSAEVHAVPGPQSDMIMLQVKELPVADETAPPEAEERELERLRRENEELRRSAGKSRKPSFWLAFFAAVFIILSCFAIAGAALASWVHYTALTTSRFVDTVAPLIKDPAVSRAVSQETVNRLFDRFDLAKRIEKEIKSLPEPFKSQASSGAAGAKNLAGTLTADILKSSAFQTAWRGILSTAHSEAVSGVRAYGSVRLNESGEIILDISHLLTDLKDRLASLGLGFLKNQTIPTGLGQVVLYKNSQLGNVKQAVSTLDDLFLVLPIGAVVLLMLGAMVSNDTRKAMLGASIGTTLVMVAVMVVALVAQSHYINQIANSTNRTAATVVANQVQLSFDYVALGLIILSLLTLIAAVVAGPYGWSVKMHEAVSLPAMMKRRHPEEAARTGFFTRFAWPLRIGGLVVAVLLLLYLPWASVALIAVVCAAYLLYLLAIEFLR